MLKALIAAMLALFATFSPALAAHDPSRIVTEVDYVSKTFSCRAKAGEPSYTYKTTKKTVFRINGKRVRLWYIWNKGSVSQIKVGTIVTVRYHMSDGSRIAERVAIYPNH